MTENQQNGLLRKLPMAILLTTLVAGTLDGIAASTQFIINTGKSPAIVFKFIASGVFGRKAFAGGAGMVAAGVFFHYLITFGLTVFFFWLYPRVNWIRRNVTLTGILYGVFAWIVTTRIIIPLSQIAPQPFELKKALVAVAILIVCIGLPIAWMTHKHYLYKK